MKKVYSLFGILAASLAFAQTPIITSVVDGDCTGGSPKVLEIYAQGTVDFTQYSVQKQSNGGAWGSTTGLSSLGTVTNGFVYVYSDGSNAGAFASEFPGATTSMASGVVNVNGDDGLRIIRTSDSSVIDTFGENGVDGTGTAWEYKDGYAKRNNNTAANATFTVSEWTVSNGGVNGQGTCQGGTSFQDVVGTGTFTTTVMGTIEFGNLSKSTSFVRNTIVADQINFSSKSDVQVIDMNGRVVKTAFVSENRGLNVSDLPKGTYIVTGLVNGEKVSEKIIKK